MSEFIDKSKAGHNQRLENVDPAGFTHSFFSPKDLGSVYLYERQQVGDEFRNSMNPNSKLSDYIAEKQFTGLEID